MPSIASELKSRTWHHDGYLVSTDHKIIPLEKLNNVLASPSIYWAKGLPLDVLEETLQQSLCFGLFRTDMKNSDSESSPNGTQLQQSGGEEHQPVFPEQSFVGFARCITDFTTFSYLTDVWVDSACRGKGLGKWMLECMRECTDSMPHLRRSMLFTSDWERSVPFYEDILSMSVLEGQRGTGVATMEWKGPGHPNFVRPGGGYD